MSQRYAEPRRSPIAGLFFIGGLVVLGLVALTVLFGSWYTVDEGVRGVILRNGRMVGVAQPGLHFKMPLLDDVEKFSTRTKVVRWEKVAAYSKDQQPADMAISVNYHIPADQVEAYYTTFGADEETIISNLIAPRAFQQLKNIFGQFTAQEAIQKRAELNQKVEAAVSTAVQGRPVLIRTYPHTTCTALRGVL